MIDLKEITKTIGEREILKDFSLSVSEGELVAITGKSGSGKSTLLNIIGLMAIIREITGFWGRSRSRYILPRLKN